MACSASTDPDCFENFGPFLPNFMHVKFDSLTDLEVLRVKKIFLTLKII